ncbi:hypothetical protein [Athalassotoga sp.]|uniref:hypothetical protein n=1 Tax=Athalassotoga sp. TaxID=2022597 RepID=UPI003D0494FE
MDIIPFISEIVNLFYDFDDIEEFYSNNTLMLVQGIIKGLNKSRKVLDGSTVKWMLKAITLTHNVSNFVITKIL